VLGAELNNNGATSVDEGPVPKELMAYLQQHKDSLIPELRKVWQAAGFKTSRSCAARAPDYATPRQRHDVRRPAGTE
jgi:hypothetical protein